MSYKVKVSVLVDLSFIELRLNLPVIVIMSV